jgi:hypothetical protein
LAGAAARLPLVVRSCRRASTGPSADWAGSTGWQAGASVTCPAGAGDGRVTMGALDVAGLGWASWDMIPNVRRADPGTLRSYGRHTDRTRLSRGEEWRIRRSAGIPMGRDGLRVKPSASPSQVRILDLPPPAETARGLGFLRVRGPLLWVLWGPAESMGVRLFPAVHGRIADSVRDHELDRGGRCVRITLGSAVHRTACLACMLPCWPMTGRRVMIR